MNRAIELSNRQWLAAFACICVSLIGCSKGTPQKTAEGLDKVTLMLNWYPEAEHGGFYAAKVHGVFERYGLDVQLKSGGPNAPVAQELLTGRCQFAVGNADDVLLFCQQDAKIVALMAPIQNTPRCILVRENSGIKSLSDLKGLTLQANAGRPFVDFMQAETLLDGVQLVPYPGTVTGLVTDANTAIQAYSFSEPLVAKQQGIKTRSLMLSDAGFNPYASCLIATQDFLDDNDDITRRMVAACREGWIQYLEDSSEANAAILADNQQGMTQEALDFGAEQLRPLCLPEGLSIEQVGQMSLDRWQQLTQQFQTLKLVDAETVKAENVFDSSYLDSFAEAPLQ